MKLGDNNLRSLRSEISPLFKSQNILGLKRRLCQVRKLNLKFKCQTFALFDFVRPFFVRNYLCGFIFHGMQRKSSIIAIASPHKTWILIFFLPNFSKLQVKLFIGHWALALGIWASTFTVSKLMDIIWKYYIAKFSNNITFLCEIEEHWQLT